MITRGRSWPTVSASTWSCTCSLRSRSSWSGGAWLAGACIVSVAIPASAGAKPRKLRTTPIRPEPWCTRLPPWSSARSCSVLLLYWSGSRSWCWTVPLPRPATSPNGFPGVVQHARRRLRAGYPAGVAGELLFNILVILALLFIATGALRRDSRPPGAFPQALPRRRRLRRTWVRPIGSARGSGAGGGRGPATLDRTAVGRGECGLAGRRPVRHAGTPGSGVHAAAALRTAGHGAFAAISVRSISIAG